MTDRYENIRKALAMGPTPGPWEIRDGRTDTVENAQGYPVCTVHYHPHERYGHGTRAAYIAACDPDTTRELLAERDALAAENARLRAAIEQAPHHGRCGSQYTFMVGGIKELGDFSGLKQEQFPCDCWKRAAIDAAMRAER